VKQKMSHPHYYLVNHTQKEFCYFDNDKPIFIVLENALKNNIGWNLTHDIRIGSEGTSTTIFINYLINDLGYVENCPF